MRGLIATENIVVACLRVLAPRSRPGSPASTWATENNDRLFRGYGDGVAAPFAGVASTRPRWQSYFEALVHACWSSGEDPSVVGCKSRTRASLAGSRWKEPKPRPSSSTRCSRRRTTSLMVRASISNSLASLTSAVLGACNRVLPNGSIVGLSKRPRIVEVFARRFRCRTAPRRSAGRRCGCLSRGGWGVIGRRICHYDAGGGEAEPKTYYDGRRGASADLRTRGRFSFLAHSGSTPVRLTVFSRRASCRHHRLVAGHGAPRHSRSPRGVRVALVRRADLRWAPAARGNEPSPLRDSRWGPMPLSRRDRGSVRRAPTRVTTPRLRAATVRYSRRVSHHHQRPHRSSSSSGFLGACASDAAGTSSRSLPSPPHGVSRERPYAGIKHGVPPCTKCAHGSAGSGVRVTLCRRPGYTALGTRTPTAESGFYPASAMLSPWPSPTRP